MTLKKAAPWAKIPFILIKNRVLNYSTRIFVSYLLCFSNRRFPSRARISKDTGLSDDTITKCIAEAMSFNILNYERGNSKHKANEYFILNESDWKIPAKLENQKSRGASEFNADLTKKQRGGTPESSDALNQKTATSKSNDTYITNRKNNKPDQSKINKGSPSSSSDRSVMLQTLTVHLHRFYGEFNKEFLKIPFDHVNEGKLTSDELDEILARLQEFTKLGGSLNCWVRNEYFRLKSKKQQRLPEPRFLARNDSRKTYLTRIQKDVFNEELSSCVHPIPWGLTKSRQEDIGYRYAIRAFRHLLEVRDLDQYVIDSLNPENKLPLMGPHLFKYALLKEYYFDKDTQRTADASSFYFDKIGHKDHQPFLGNMMKRPIEYLDMEGWPERRIQRGSGRKYDIFSVKELELLQDPDSPAQFVH